ncbi:MAG: glycine cleavage system protein T [Deltaproteobacteria bacterium RBG_16_49_23]|nr:MAG: glycine cleavage system protein T [Deltaproteobacteria bacterium RBG_16_49_23]
MGKDLKRTELYSWHKEHGGQMIEFAGWEMPVSYGRGIFEEHLSTRKYGGLFDISHMGRFLIHGEETIPFLQYILTNNVLALEHGMAQYTLIQNEWGGAIDDAYLYRLDEGNLPSESRYLLVVNAANKEKDWNWFMNHKKRFRGLVIEDKSEEMGMIALQGPVTKRVLEKIVIESHSKLPDPWRNRLRVCEIEGVRVAVTISRTGYTGEPICFELFSEREKMRMIWEAILAVGEKEGIAPVGLGARDTLRTEAGLPLYGHELGVDQEGKEVPIHAVYSAGLAVSFSPLKGDFIGKEALRRQFEELKARTDGIPLPPREKQTIQRRVVPIAIVGSRGGSQGGQAIARQGYEVFVKGRKTGYVTSGTMVPYWIFSDEGILSKPSEEKGMRAIALACIDSDFEDGQRIEIQQRGKTIEGVVVEKHLSGEAPPYARPILFQEKILKRYEPAGELKSAAQKLIERAITNTHWRQRETINLIPSEQTPSTLVRLLTIMDPSHRYAEHRIVKALGEKEIFYYQGTKLIEEVEAFLSVEMRDFLGCSEVEARVISGQMANAVVFSGLMDYLNRLDRKSEPRRIRKVMNHHLGRGGHLSAQPMGALRDFIAIDPLTERPSVVPFPVMKEDLYQIDLLKTEELLEIHKPELIILGKSMVLYKEPLKEIARLASGMKPRPIIHYDMAHVLGLIGPYFQEPFKEGADIVTGSTHKTFFGPQRGVIGSHMGEGTEYEDLWEAIVRRVFPGSVSNHHLGTLLGLLMAAYEMNVFKSEYQKAVISNAKAFAHFLKDQGLIVEGDPEKGYTETHQVIVRVGYGKGPVIAERLEENNIIVNYQAAPDDEAFTAASCLRMGVQEMTRFGMMEKDFGLLAEYMSEVILHDRLVAKEVSGFRKRFTEMKYCLPETEAASLVNGLIEAIR